jgi:hypothetical protein
MLSPAYVINEDIDDTNIPPNIGVCKNGFGGFAAGIRVFRNDEDADKLKAYYRCTCERVAPGVYIWWQDT